MMDDHAILKKRCDQTDKQLPVKWMYTREHFAYEALKLRLRQLIKRYSVYPCNH